ncbi:hypothetical protein GCM10022631_10890 [Deinococcus rubellus]|uniref:hypothetical protein n=1 Tax=Deinococcus rubellus TaxID=1889240 RepID=UPI0031E9AF32
MTQPEIDELPQKRNNLIKTDEDTWDTTGVKTSERFLAFLESEYVRELAKSRMIDDRAKSIITLAAVALPALGLLKPATFSLGYITAVLVTLAWVIYTLRLAALIFANRDSESMAIRWFRGMYAMVYREEVLYADLLAQLQNRLTDELEGQRAVNRERFNLLDRLQYVLLIVLGFSALAILISFI